MIYQKKTTFFKRITSKMTNAKRNNGEKEHKRSHPNNQDGNKKTQEYTFLKQIPGNDLSLFDDTRKKDLSASANLSGSHPVQDFGPKEPRNSLLAAKLKCDEWGMHAPKPVARTAKKIAIASEASDTSLSKNYVVAKTISVRIDKAQHPSYKTVTSRYRSMKERREAKEKAQKFRRFYSTLTRIDEVDEKGIE